MSYRIDPGERFDRAVRRIAQEQISKALEEIEGSDLDVHETVHQVRKRCKKLRGLVRLVRPSLGERYQLENAAFRDAARLLSSSRDANALLECFDSLMQHCEQEAEAFASVRETLARRRDALNLEEELERSASEMKMALQRLDKWELDGHDFEIVRGGLEKTYRRARNRMAEAYEQTTSVNLHEWRKRAKYHWYHIRLLRDAWPDALDVRRRAADELSDLLGEDHDLAVLHDTVCENGFDESHDMVRLVTLRRRQLQARAHPLGRRLFCEKPKQFGTRVETYWQCRLEESAINGYRGVDGPGDC